MNIIRQFSTSSGLMIPRLALLLMLIISLLFVARAQPAASPVEMKPGGVCAGMQCTRGCCANTACCKIVEQQRTSQPQAPARQDAHFQFEAVRPRLCFLFVSPPTPSRSFVILDEANTAHGLSPLMLICIRLI